MAQQSSLLSVQNLNRQLSQRWLWRGVSFVLQPGDCVGLIGASGSGKTLLLRSLFALDPIDKNKISFDHRPLSQAQIERVTQRQIYLSEFT
jgi:putative ABC transport system ATP-binding protein